jgi:hypothetical protein
LVPLTASVIYLNSICFNINQIIEAIPISIIVRVPVSQLYVQLNLTHLEADSPTSKPTRILEVVRGSHRPFQG